MVMARTGICRITFKENNPVNKLVKQKKKYDSK